MSQPWQAVVCVVLAWIYFTIGMLAGSEAALTSANLFVAAALIISTRGRPMTAPARRDEPRIANVLATLVGAPLGTDTKAADETLFRR